MIPITGNEVVNIMDCAKIVVNEGFRIQYGPIIGLAIVATLLYIFWVVAMLRIHTYRKFLREKKKFEEFIIWNHRRKEEK